MINYTEINAIGTLVFAAIVLFAIFYPQMREYLTRPRFGFEIVSLGNSPGQVQTIYVRVQNTGARVAHGLIGLIEIRDTQGNTLLHGRIPVRERTEIYDGISVYPLEKVMFLCMLSGQYKMGIPPSLLFTSYPFEWGGPAISPLTSLSAMGDIEVEKYIKEGVSYLTAVMISCENSPKNTDWRFNFVYKDGKVSITDRHIVVE